MGKHKKVNKPLLVMFWLDWIKSGAVSYSFSCMFKSSPHTCEVSSQKGMLKIWIVKRQDIQNPILEVPRLEFFEKHAILKHLLQCLAHIELLRLLYQWQQLFCPFWYKIQFFIIICSYICKLLGILFSIITFVLT